MEYYIFNNNEYLGCYKIFCEISEFKNSFAVNHNLDVNNLSLSFTNETFDTTNKTIKYFPDRIELYSLEEVPYTRIMNVSNKNLPGLSNEEILVIESNYLILESDPENLQPWPTREEPRTRIEEVLDQTIPLTEA